MGQPEKATNGERVTLEEALNKYETALEVLAERQKNEATNYESEVGRLRDELFQAISQATNVVNQKKPERLVATINGSDIELIYRGRSVTITMRVDKVVVMYSNNKSHPHRPSDWQLRIKKPEDGTGKPCELFVVFPNAKQPATSRPLVGSTVDSDRLHLFLAGLLIPPLEPEILF